MKFWCPFASQATPVTLEHVNIKGRKVITSIIVVEQRWNDGGHSFQIVDGVELYPKETT